MTRQTNIQMDGRMDGQEINITDATDRQTEWPSDRQADTD
jgi:hypothetical protein